MKLGVNQEVKFGRYSLVSGVEAKAFRSPALGGFWGVQASHAKKILEQCRANLGRMWMEGDMLILVVVLRMLFGECHLYILS